MTTRARYGVAALGVIAGGLLSAAALAGASAAPGAVADASNPARQAPCRFTAWAPDTASSWAAQTFTAGTTGYLTDVVLPLRGPNNQITVAITGVDGSGTPAPSPPLASITVPITPFTGTGYVDVAFNFPNPAKVEAGKMYAIMISSATENADAGVYVSWRDDGGSSLRDPNGTPCADGVYAGGRAWAFDPGPPGPDADFFFTTFVLPVRHLTVQKAGAGAGTVRDTTNALACGATCSVEFKAGQSVTLSASPAAGSTFAGWSGACSGAALSCTLTIAADTAVTATFSQKPGLLTVRRVGKGTITSRPAGISCGTRCRARLPAGPATLTARPAAGSRFSKWSGACHGTKPTCRVMLPAGGSRSATAIFVKR